MHEENKVSEIENIDALIFLKKSHLSGHER